tara:strand:- start:4598 stop:5014 length:417 start_codon:yes stop_codon:yes gene_type:complete
MIHLLTFIIIIIFAFYLLFHFLKNRKKKNKYYFSKYLKRDYVDLKKKYSDDVIFSEESMTFLFYYLYKNNLFNDLNYILDFIFFDKTENFKIELLQKYSEINSFNKKIKKDVNLIYQDQLYKKQYYAYWQNYVKNIYL